MIEIRMPIDEATMGDLRKFVKLAADAPDDMPVMSIDHHDEIWGIAAVVSADSLQAREEE